MKDQRLKRLRFLLEKSGAYATILGTKLAKQQEQARERAAQLETVAETQPVENHGKTRKTRASNPKRKTTTDADYQLTDYLQEDVNKNKKSTN